MSDLDHLVRSPSYVKAYEDVESIKRDELRSVRLQLELLKPELVQQEAGIESTIVVFGSARTPSPDEAQRDLLRARERLAAAPDDPSEQTTPRNFRACETRRRVGCRHRRHLGT